MKAYQIYEIVKFPILKLGGVDVTCHQLTLWGINEEVQTKMKYIERDVAGFEVWRIESKIPVNVFGTIKFWDAQRNELVTKDFNEYLRPVDFQAYVHRKDGFVLFQQSKDVCKGVFDHIKKSSPTTVLKEKRVDFAKLLTYTSQYAGAWFQKVSPNIKAEGLSGEGVEHDPRFKELVKSATLTSLTVKHKQFDSEHKIQVTKTAAVVLVSNYDSVKVELDLVQEFKKNVIHNVWQDKV